MSVSVHVFEPKPWCAHCLGDTHARQVWISETLVHERSVLDDQGLGEALFPAQKELMSAGQGDGDVHLSIPIDVPGEAHVVYTQRLPAGCFQQFLRFAKDTINTVRLKYSGAIHKQDQFLPLIPVHVGQVPSCAL